MLVDLTPIPSEAERCLQILAKEIPEISEKDRWKYIQSDPRLHEETGVYLTLLNFGFNFFEETHDCNVFDIHNQYWYDQDSGTNSYGVADNLEQVKKYFQKQIEDPDHRYFISLAPIWQEKQNAGKGGGWRWHKWGPYIGTLNPQCEYLDDEEFGPDFCGYVFVFHCYRLDRYDRRYKRILQAVFFGQCVYRLQPADRSQNIRRNPERLA